MLRRVMLSALVLALVPLPGIAGGDADPWYEWSGEPALIANAGVYRHGEFIYNDYVYDDHGANTDGKDRLDLPFGAWPDPSRPGEARFSPTGGAVRHAGDFMYAADDDNLMRNVADLLEFRVTTDPDDVFLHARFGDMTAEDSNVIAACIDTDLLAATGVQSWPHGANMTARLGCDLLVTAWGTGASVATSDGVADLASLDGDVRADVAEATIDLRLPKSQADPGDDTWRMWVASGIWDAAASSWLQVPPIPQAIGEPLVSGGGLGVPNVWDLLSNNNESNSYWMEEKQANDLARSYIFDDFVDVDFDRLKEHDNDPDPQITGFMQRIYISEHPMDPPRGIIAEGDEPTTNFEYLGPYQPYAMVVPSRYYDEPNSRWAYDECLHPLNGNHMVEVYYSQAFYQGEGYNPLVTGTVPQTGYLGFSEIEGLADRLGTLYSCVLGRGEGVGYTGGDGLVDALEVQADVLRRYRVDEDRVTVHGVSLGAIGSWYMSQLYPDRYSAVMPYIFSPNIVAGDLPRLMNLHNTPVFYAIGTLDQFAQGTQGDPTADRMEEEGNEYVYVHYLGRQHEGRIEGDFLPFTEALAYPRTRVEDPARVRYRFDAGAFSSKIPGDGSAYWVRASQARSGDSSTVDVTSLARAEQLPTHQVIFDGLYTNTIEGWQARIRGLLRVSEAEFQAIWQPAQWEPGWEELSLEVTEAALEPRVVSNGFELTSSNLGAVTLDTDRMDLDTDEPIVGIASGDGPTSFTLLGIPGGASVTMDGDPVTTDLAFGGITFTVDLSGGPHTLVIG